MKSRPPHPPRPDKSGGSAPRAIAHAALRQAGELAASFKMLGNPNRVRILVYLDNCDRSVREIEAALKIRQPTLSQQLGELRDAGYIVGRRIAKSVVYALTADRGRRALNTIYSADAREPPPAEPPEAHTRPRKSSPAAAVFASVVTAPGGVSPEWHVGFNSLLRE